jgi:D-sedoheptulose 7-phosphate isomerase
MIRAHEEAVSNFKQNGTSATSKIAEMTIAALKQGGCVYLCGNGGSAADCQHIAGEFIGRFRRERKALPAVALSTDTSVLTCIGNDYGFEDIFARQVEGLVGNADLLWAFSTSGTSPNILKAAKLAKANGAKVIAFTGKAGSELETLSDACLCADTEYTSTAQEVHMLAYHIISNLVEAAQ